RCAEARNVDAIVLFERARKGLAPFAERRRGEEPFDRLEERVDRGPMGLRHALQSFGERAQLLSRLPDDALDFELRLALEKLAPLLELAQALLVLARADLGPLAHAFGSTALLLDPAARALHARD